MKDTFILNNDLMAGGTCLQNEIEATYSELKTLFGEAGEADEYKVSGEWLFEDANTQEVVTLYDWKETALYDSDYPSVEEFRSRESYTSFHIGARNQAVAERFLKFLTKKLNHLRSPQSIKFITEE